MEYKAKLPTRNSNVSHAEPLKEFTTLIIGGALVLAFVYWVLGFLVDYAVDTISDETATELYLSLNNVTDEQLLSDTQASLQLQALLNKLTSHSEINYPIQLSVANIEQMNALAFPSGHIIVFQELLDNITSENGLAFVLAHELAHFKNRDHLRSMGRGVLLLTTSMVLGIGNNDVVQMMSPVTDLGMAQYSQERESAADATALKLLNKHYGHIGGATEFFEILKKTDTDYSFAGSHYFSSHPQLEQRIEQVHALGKSLGFVAKQLTPIEKSINN